MAKLFHDDEPDLPSLTEWLLTLVFCVAIVGLLLLAVGCREVDPRSPIAPGAVVRAATTPLTIQTRWYGSALPLAGAHVTVDGLDVGTTDTRGLLDLDAPTGYEIWVGVSSPDHVLGCERADCAFTIPMVTSASGTLKPNSHERWTFYFERAR